MYVFVYGTLRKGEKDHELLASSTCISEQAWTSGKLVDERKSSPKMISSEHDLTFGEVYKVHPEVTAHLENLPHNKDCEKKRVLIHLHDRQLDGITFVHPEPEKAEVIPSGDWKVYQMIHQPSCLYFAYGSCMDHERFEQNDVIHLFKEIQGGASLDHYKLGFSFHREDGGRADIIEENGQTVEGILYKVSPEAVRYLYEREGVFSKGYRPTVVRVKKHDGEIREALSFTVIEKKGNKTPPLHYAKEIHRGGTPYLTLDYIKELENRFINELEVEEFESYLSESKQRR